MQIVVVYAALAALAMGIITELLPLIIVDFSPWSTIGDIFNYGFYFIPLGTFLWCFGIVIMIQQADLIWAGVMWIIRRIPGQG